MDDSVRYYWGNSGARWPIVRFGGVNGGRRLWWIFNVINDIAAIDWNAYNGNIVSGKFGIHRSTYRDQIFIRDCVIHRISAGSTLAAN